MLRCSPTFAHLRRALTVGCTTAVLLTASAGAVGATVPPIGPPVRTGDVVLVNPYDQSKEITHGSGTTAFSLRLPDGSVCPGDSANDQWRVQTFLLPAGDDPTTVRYGAIGPEPVGNGRYAMFGIDTVPFVHGLTRRNPSAGSPGVIPPFPPFSLAVVAGESIPSGTYTVGVSCTYFGATALYWDTTVVITDPPGGDAGSLSWRLPDVPETVASRGSSPWPWTLSIVGGCVALAAGVLVIWRRSTRRVISLVKEPS